MSEPVPWRMAWERALYGPDGFYRRPEGPAGHFATATHGGTGQALARTLWAWADRYGLDGFVDVGAGRGELLRHLYASRPGRPLSGLDVVPRPADLPEDVGWVESPGGAGLPAAWRPDRALVVAHEWLDVVPCTIAEVAPDGTLRELLATPPIRALNRTESGSYTTNSPWDHAFPGRISSGASGSGRQRSRRRLGPAIASRSAASATRRGRLCWTDWPPARSPWPWTTGIPSRTGHGRGRSPHTGRGASSTPSRTAPATSPPTSPSTRCARRVGFASARRSRAWRSRATRPRRVDPAGYLQALADQSAVAELRRPGGFGDFWWVIAEV